MNPRNAHELYLARLRRMSGSERVRLGAELYRFSIAIVKAGIKNENPGIGKAELRRKLIERINPIEKHYRRKDKRVAIRIERGVSDELLFDQAKTLSEITALLEENDIRYMLTGCVAVNYYGRPRSTQDIDIVVELFTPKINKLVKSLKMKNYYVAIEAIEEAMRTSGRFDVFHKATNVKTDFWMIKDDDYSKLRFSRRKKVPIFGRKMWIASAEDTILIKLMWFSRWKDTKHYNDALGIYQVQKGKLDMKYLETWAKKNGVERYLTRLEREVNKIWL